jgi:ABC-type dipeptide/oligopeptide/nickel transport system permease subunit
MKSVMRLAKVNFTKVTILGLLALALVSFTPWIHSGLEPDVTSSSGAVKWLHIHTTGHILGTEGQGRDMLAVLIVSIRNSLILGSIAVLVSVVLGGTFGILLGYILNRGPLERILLFVARIVKSIPLLMWIFLLVFWTEVLSSIIPFLESETVRMPWVFGLLGMIYSFNLALFLRGHIKKLKASQFIEACEALGLKKSTIIFRHIIWHCSKDLFGNQASYIFVQCILLEITLSFHAIGYGYSPNSLSLGSLFDRAVFERPMSQHMYMPLLAAFLLTLLFSIMAQRFGRRLG